MRFPIVLGPISLLIFGCANAAKDNSENTSCSPSSKIQVQFALRGGEGLGEKLISEFEADPKFAITSSQFILNAFKEACRTMPSRAIKLEFALGRLYDPKSKVSIWLLSSNEVVMRGHVIPLKKKTSDDLFESVEELFPDTSNEER